MDRLLVMDILNDFRKLRKDFMIPGCSVFIIPIEYPLFCVLCFVNPFGFVSLYFSIRYDIYEPNNDDLMTTLKIVDLLIKEKFGKVTAVL